MKYRNLPKPRHYRDNLGIRHIDGETVMGRYRYPPPPPRIALTDYTTMLPYVLTHDVTLSTVILAAPQSNWSDVNTYEEGEGPTRSGWMLYLNNGVLAFKAIPTTNGGPVVMVDGPRILTRNGFDTVLIQIEPDANGNVVLSTYDLNGTL